jgi:outer membrane protein assembly factor BamB
MHTLLASFDPKTLKPKWTSENLFGALTEPLLAAGDKLIAVAGSTMFAIDIHTGELANISANGDKWIYPLSGTGSVRPTACDGVLYLLDGDRLLALRLADATPLPGWKPPTLEDVSTLTARDGRVVAVGRDPETGAAKVSQFVAASGASIGAPVQISTDSPGPIAATDKVAYFVVEQQLHAVNLDFGETSWRFGGDGKTVASMTAPLVAGDVVLVSGSSLFGVKLAGGAQRFKIAASDNSGNVQWYLPAVDVPTPVRAATLAVNRQAVQSWSGTRHLLLAAEPVLASVKAGTGVASNSAGDLVCFSLDDGKVHWRTSLPAPGAPIIIDNVVYVTINGGQELAFFDYHTGAPFGESVKLENLSAKQRVVIANGALFLASESGSVTAQPFSSQSAAYFDGYSAMVKIKQDGARFDFGLGDFTVEAWFRSSTGGEIISSHATNNMKEHGFRINMTATGQIRVGIFNRDGSSMYAGRTNSTGAVDGNWHHVALIRRNGSFLIILDGQSQEVRLKEDPAEFKLLRGTSVVEQARLSINGQSAVTIGAFVPAPGAIPAHLFRGLIREVRIWGVALDVTAIENQLHCALIGNEPQLRGLWQLDMSDATAQPYNAAGHPRVFADFVEAACLPTDLIIDRSMFPYLLNEAAPQWPYSSSWAVRGQMQMTGEASLSHDGVVAFSTNNSIYAVDAHDGKRIWAMDLAQGASDPVGEGDGFLLLTRRDSLLYIGARNGARVRLPVFGQMKHNHGAALPAPASDGNYVAAATGSGQAEVVVWDFVSPRGNSINLPGTPLKLSFCHVGLLVLTRVGKQHHLYLLDPANGSKRGSCEVPTAAFCCVGDAIFVVSGKRLVKLSAADLSSAPLQTSVDIDGEITSLLAASDDDLLVAVTATGVAVGLHLAALTIKWSRTLPVAKGSSNKAVNTPVLTDDGHVLCTTASGSVAILHSETGALLTRYMLLNGAIGTPLLNNGTLYTGCVDTISNDADPLMDGALHSVVIGNTMALRLNLDDHGLPAVNGTRHAIIEETADTTLHLLEPHESCVEAWINVPALKGEHGSRLGGGILGIAPTTTSQFDINLWLDADGTLHYASRALDDKIWSGLHVTAATRLIDGAWHHLAASRRPDPEGGADKVRLYIDGVEVISKQAEAPGAPVTLAARLQATIGATLDDKLAPSRPFCGMIAEVRVWDTYLTPGQLAARKQVKLRGDEPDLLAYWNFDYCAVHDSALQGHEGKLSAAAKDAPSAWWMTDLPFTHPDYPYITNQAAISAQGEGKPTSYKLKLKVCAANGNGMSGQRVHMWYMRQDDKQPLSVLINGTEVQGVKSGEEDDPVLLKAKAERVHTATTGADGTLELTVTTSEPGHGPSLDIWTAFMPVNERFHVNVLLDNQKLAKPAPPTLTAQSKLIQDYHYTDGNTIDHTRDRSTWRVVLRARESDNSTPRPSEPITLWAETATSIEVLNKSYKINAENSVTINAEVNGEMTIVMSADGLVSPVLYARAGFMPRNDRVVVNADQDAHAQLSNMKDEDLTKPRVTNWKNPKQHPVEVKHTLIDDKYSGQASKIAEAVRRVTAVAAAPDPIAAPRALRASPARRKLIAIRAAQHNDSGLLHYDAEACYTPSIAAMQQVESVTPTDHVLMRRTMAGNISRAPINPDAFRAAMGPGMLGFIFEPGNASGEICTPLYTREQVLRARGMATPVLQRSLQQPQLGGWFDDFCDGISDVANTIYDGVTKIVVTIADSVELAITTLVDGIESIVHKVVDSVKDALNAVASFFEQLAAGVMKVIEFLRALFNWKAIIETQQILHGLFLDIFASNKISMKDKTRLMTAAKAMRAGALEDIPANLPSSNSRAQREGKKDAPVLSSADSVESKSMLQKSTSNSPRSDVSLPDVGPKLALMSAASLALDSPIETMLRAIPKLAGSLLELSPKDMVTQLQAIIKSISLESALESVAGGSSEIIDGVDALIQLLNTRIDIPFVSELYKWVTGQDLSILSLLCLGLAVMVNVAYALVTLLMGGTRIFADDARDLRKQYRISSGLDPALATSTAPAVFAGETMPVPPTRLVYEVLYCSFRLLTICFDTIADFQYYKYRSTHSAAEKKILAVFKIFQGVSGGVAAGLQFFLSRENYLDRLKATVTTGAMTVDERKAAAAPYLPPMEWLPYVVFSVQALLRSAKVVMGIYALAKTGSELLPDASSTLDRWELKITGCEAIGGMVIIGLLVDSMALVSKLEAHGNSNVAKEFELFIIRDIISCIPMMTDWMYTDEGFRLGASPVGIYNFHTVTRGLSNVASLGVHCAAVFGYGNIK